MRTALLVLLLCAHASLAQPAGYLEQLKTLREPSLSELSQRDPNAEVYRFTWLRVSGPPVSVRLVMRSNGSGWIHSRGHGHYSVFWLRKSQTQALRAAFERGFGGPPPSPTAPAHDGAQWILERVKHGEYQIIDRWSPKKDDPARTVGLTSLKMARYRIRPADIY